MRKEKRLMAQVSTTVCGIIYLISDRTCNILQMVMEKEVGTMASNEVISLMSG